MRKSLPAVLSWSIAVSALLVCVGCIAHAPGSGGGSQTTTVAISPTTASVAGGSTITFNAVVTGPEETSVLWYVNGIQNGNPTIGTFAAAATPPGAVYTAPSTVPNPNTVSITAGAVANGTLSPVATVTITQSTVAVGVLPATATVDTGTSQTFTATVTGTTNVAVGWYVNGILNGNSSVGTITPTSTSTGSSAVYTAPTVAPLNTATVTIMAQSIANSGASASATVTIPPIVVTLSPPSGVSIPVNGTQLFTATVTGTGGTGVTDWQVNGVPGGNSIVGTINSSGADSAIYTAPASLGASPTTVMITAVSGSDSSVEGSILANVHVTVTISPTTDTIGQSANLLYTATVNGANAANQGVNWLVISPNGGGFVPVSDTTDVPSNQGIYIAPPLSQGVSTMSATIQATSQFDQTQSQTATMTVQQTDPLGKVSNVTALPVSQCPTGTEDRGNSSCYSLNVSCDGIADWTTYLKVNTPTSNPPLGTVLFAGDDGGANLYDTEFTHGSDVVGDVVTDGYTAVQISFGAPFDNGANPNGWLTGPGGVRRLACRFATVADWIYNNPQLVNGNATSTAPVCATGNGAGAGAIGYAVSEYGMNGLNQATGVNSNFAMVELTSGPMFTAVDQGCICSTGANGPSGAICNPQPAPMCYTAGMTTIDAAYSQPSVCSSGNTNNTLLLTSDSIYYQRGKGAVFPLPNTTLNMEFGASDTDSGEPQGWQWKTVLLANTPPPAVCQPNASHALPDDSSSAGAIAADIKANCKSPADSASMQHARKSTVSRSSVLDPNR